VYGAPESGPSILLNWTCFAEFGSVDGVFARSLFHMWFNSLPQKNRVLLKWIYWSFFAFRCHTISLLKSLEPKVNQQQVGTSARDLWFINEVVSCEICYWREKTIFHCSTLLSWKYNDICRHAVEYFDMNDCVLWRSQGFLLGVKLSLANKENSTWENSVYSI
jgi:hypothetical protein